MEGSKNFLRTLRHAVGQDVQCQGQQEKKGPFQLPEPCRPHWPSKVARGHVGWLWKQTATHTGPGWPPGSSSQPCHKLWQWPQLPSEPQSPSFQNLFPSCTVTLFGQYKIMAQNAKGTKKAYSDELQSNYPPTVPFLRGNCHVSHVPFQKYCLLCKFTLFSFHD